MRKDVAELGGIIVCWKVNILGLHAPTGRTTHYCGAEILPPPTELQIIKYRGEDGYNLVHLYGAGREVTDTFHGSVYSAKEQAEWEFGKGLGWQRVGQCSECDD